jgi:hypothetical protein
MRVVDTDNNKVLYMYLSYWTYLTFFYVYKVF